MNEWLFVLVPLLVLPLVLLFRFVGCESFGASARPDDAPLFIGVSNRTSDPSNPAEPRNPVLSLIQEVVLYRKALSQDEIENHFDINK